MNIGIIRLQALGAADAEARAWLVRRTPSEYPLLSHNAKPPCDLQTLHKHKGHSAYLTPEKEALLIGFTYCIKQMFKKFDSFEEWPP
jgi:hypothetical protein